MKKLKITILVLFLFCIQSCYTDCNDPVCLYYQPVGMFDGKTKRVTKNSVSLIQIAGDTSKVEASIKKQGYSLTGEAKFSSGFGNYNTASQKKAAEVGARYVVIGFKKSGKNRGERMTLAAETSPSLGLTTSNAFGSIISGYGTTTYSGSAIGTSYQPGQQYYVRQEYEYDNFEYTIKFYK
jgi:hypothetical protein